MPSSASFRPSVGLVLRKSPITDRWKEAQLFSFRSLLHPHTVASRTPKLQLPDPGVELLMDLTDIRSLARRLLGLVALASLGIVSAGEVGCSGGASGGDGGASDGSGSDDTGSDIKDGPYTVGPVSGKVSGLPDSCSQP